METIVGIDVGYGHTKWATTDETGTRHGMFPSVAPITTRERIAETNGLSNLRTVTVAVNERNYVIGRDAHLESDANYSRTRLENYSQTDGYRALMLGALAISGQRHISHLVIGLPLSTLAMYHSQLQKLYAGEHQIGSTTARRKTEVFVENVNVTSQPAAAMVNAVAMSPALRKTTNMVIDMGYFTMDFLMTEGLRPFYPRSGAIIGGMSGYYDYLGALVSDKLNSAGGRHHAQSGIDHFRLEKSITGAEADGSGALRYTLQIGNKDVDITECVEGASTKLEEYLDRMVTTLGRSSLNEIRTIVFAGGGATVMLPVVKKKFGDEHNFVVLNDAQFAIANGYVLIGRSAASKRTSAAVA